MDDVKRCRICNWPIRETVQEGCTDGSCSYRPKDGTDEHRRITARRTQRERAAAMPTLLTVRGLDFLRDDDGYHAHVTRLGEVERRVTASLTDDGGALASVSVYGPGGWTSFQAETGADVTKAIEAALDRAEAGARDVLAAISRCGSIGGVGLSDSWTPAHQAELDSANDGTAF